MYAPNLASALRTDRTYITALALIALLGAAELAAVAVYFATRGRPYTTVGPTVVAVPEATPAAPAAIPETAPAPAVPSQPTAAPATAATPAAAPAQRLLQEARALRAKADTTNALARLHDAQQVDPKNAEVLAEMALIYESIQLLDRSNDTWRRIQEIGPAAGPLYELADMKLKMGIPAPTAPPSTAVIESATTQGEVDGIPEGSTFGISEITPIQTADPEAELKLMLRVGVKKRPATPVDHTKVKIQVFFYDLVDNSKVVLTDADVSYEWLTPKHDWTDANPEVLAVTYVRPKNPLASEAALTEAAAAVNPPVPGKKNPTPRPLPEAEGGPRKYFGYIVRVYYNDQLQAVRAEPTKLLNLFPPPFTAPST